MKKILGLDLGTNSIGWALIEQDEQNREGKIIGLGSRIIPMSQDILGKFDSGVSISQTAERTNFRSVRRLRERHLLRRERLHRVLNILGFLPEHYANQIDFRKKVGQFFKETEPKLPWKKISENNFEFIFKESFEEMVKEFKERNPSLFYIKTNGEEIKIPYDWTIYYLRKKALTQKIEKEELAWLLLNFNQKRGYYQLRGEEEEENPNKLVEFHSLKVVDVTVDDPQKGKEERWYSIILENGWIYRRSSKIPLFDWKEKTKDFIVTTDLNDDGSIKTDKEGKEKRSFRAPGENDWGLVKTKTEQTIDKSGKTVGEYIYDTLLENPTQKINGQLVRVIERKFYKDELKKILETQLQFHAELQNKNLYYDCISELYEYNEVHRNSITKKNFVHLFLNDIIFYQRPLKSKTSQISNCRYEERIYKDKNGVFQKDPVKCIAKSHPLFQEFRLWQWIRNLQIFERNNDEYPVTSQFFTDENDYVSLFDFLNKRKEITQDILLKYLFETKGFKGKELTAKIANYRWNFIDDKEKKYPCNETRSQIVSRLEKCIENPEDFLTKEKEEALWHILYSISDKTELEKALEKFAGNNNLNDCFVEQFKKFPPYKNEYGSYSAKAIKKLLPLMRMGKYWNEMSIHSQTKERIDKIITGECDENIQDRVREKAINLSDLIHFKGLPLWLACYIVYDRHSEESDLQKWKTPKDLEDFLKKFRQHSLRNPIVEQVVTETLRVVNDIWETYGNGVEDFFNEIHVELGREMKNPADKRRSITQRNNENENTNLRIKALLTELINDKDFENVRPYSPMQQELLKIYEEYAITNEEAYDEDKDEFIYSPIPEDIEKISKMAQPSKNDIIRYKLWLEQRYRSPYTGDLIPLNKLFTSAYEIEHIIPQSRYFDDSFSNKVICEAEVNKLKENMLALEFIQSHGTEKVILNFRKTVRVFSEDEYKTFIKEHYAQNRSKRKKLELIDIPEEMIERQMNDTRYISKEIKNLLSKIVREEKDDDDTTSKNVLSSNGQITSILKQNWGLNDVWNDIVEDRFKRLNEITGNTGKFGEINPNTNKFLPAVPLECQKGYNKKRIDHRHHAADAVIIACATRNIINFLNNQSALEKGRTKEQKQKLREDLRRILCDKKYNDGSEKNYKWVFKKPWETFTQEVRDELLTTVVSFKQDLRIINKTVNCYEKWINDENRQVKKGKAKQSKGNNWAIRKPLHKETVFGQVKLRFKKTVSLSIALDNWQSIVDKSVKEKIKELINQYNYDKKMLSKFFKDRNNRWNEKDISKVEIYYFDNENVATRVKLDDSFHSKKIGNITDTSIQKILINHLEKYNSSDGKEHPELAFSPEGIEELNKNIKELNGGKPHQPIGKVRVYEPKGNKYSVGITGNKKDKFVEAAKGTNLYFAIYSDKNNKRTYQTIPLNIVIENQKQGLPAVSERYMDEKGEEYKLLFWLSPNDLVYVPTEEEKENPHTVDFGNLKKEQVKRIYKFVSCTGNEGHFVPVQYAKEILKNEMGTNNKSQNDLNGTQIKSVCWKLNVDRLGKVRFCKM